MNQHVTPPRNRPWSQDDAASAADIWQRFAVDPFDHEHRTPQGTRVRTLQRIAVTLDRSYDSVAYRLETFGASFGCNARNEGNVPANVMADSAARQEAARRRDLTASVFGDPPPGFSALDRRGCS